MNRRIIKYLLILIVIATMIGVGVGLYFHYHQGPIVGRIAFGQKYYLTEIRTTERFEGATMNRASYFEINNDKKTGKLYLVGLNATTAPIPFIVTNYQEGVNNTVIDFEYVIDNGEKTKIQRLQAISNDHEIRIKAVESHGVQVTQQNADKKLNSLDYAVTILVFAPQQEAAA